MPDRPPLRPRHARQAGFTLMEMLVVLVIIGLLLGLVGMRLLSNVDRGKVTAATAQARVLKTALDTLNLDIGRFPTKAEGLSLLVTPPKDGSAARRWMGPYLEGGVPNDPWDRPYLYEPDENGRAVRVVTLGADGKPGGSGADADISVPGTP
ncbi:type II secretion system major pseudopilin GspG [Niveispirillum sp.]|uniref:type II secretion system major pseudopilin GspG n=1 Tax=Niveispirillum sp. TaxID=1917217 RepID=UPI001B5F28C8|nr:type II secretion system major pseudopilin GspG [Niveispirillum sp.]MBP7340180.1 type II secretion system major pseudopilin GspG [Niveispirillum sp.]